MEPGTDVGPYRIVRHLGTGGMGSVWLADDTRLHRQVALKTLRAVDDDSQQGRARLMREARAAAALNQANIAAVHDVLEIDGQVVIVFEYVEGETLAARISRGAIPAPEAVDIACQIARALVTAHAHGVVHRDLKPANVIVGAGGQIKVLDFGIARVLSTGTTQTINNQPTAIGVGLIGTAGYAAPEQMVSGAVDERADLYALGVMLFEMISGRRPFPGNDPVALATAKLEKVAPLLSSTGRLVPPDLERIVAALLSRDRDSRPASAEDVLVQLRAVYGIPHTALGSPLGRRASWPMPVGVVALALVLFTGAWLQFRPTAPVASSAPPVVAVLPLTNMSGDPTKDFVAAGIAESLITSLAGLPTITVLSRAAVSEARGRSAELSVLAKDLGATYFIEGSVQESGGQLRVSLNLVRADRSVAWGDTVEGTFSQIFDLQSQLAGALTAALDVRLSPEQRQRMSTPATANTEALTAYWQGRALMERRDVKGNVDAAASAYTQALMLDPKFALAHAAIGEAYWQKYVDSREPSWAQKATDEGQTALRLDANAPAVRYTLAITLAGTGKLAEAAGELRRALAIQPNYDDARRQLGQVLAQLGQVDQAVVEYRKAIALRPTFWGHYSAMGNSLLQAGRYAEAGEAFQKVIELQPDSFFGYQQVGVVHHNLTDYDEALKYYAMAIERRPNAQAYSGIGAIHHERGEYAAAVDAYRHALELRPNSHTTHRNLGDALARMGKRAEAMDEYGKAIRLAETELKVNQKDAGILSSLAVYLQKAGREDDAVVRISQALAARSSDWQVAYRAAVVHALAGRSAAALESLDQSVTHGAPRTRIAADEDFESLRARKEFQRIVNPSSVQGAPK